MRPAPARLAPPTPHPRFPALPLALLAALALFGQVACVRREQVRITSTPAFVAAMDLPRPVEGTPASRPDLWRLAFVDVETTGLVPGWHEMIDIGMVITDLEGVSLDSLFLRIQPEHPERLSEGAREVNAFDAARWRERGALAPAQAADSIVRFRERVAGEAHVLMVAYNSQFDTAFLDHLFRGSGRSWRELFHYFVLDVPSMAWALGHRELTGSAITARLGVPDEPHVADDHTGITGAAVNARIYRALLPGRDRPARR
jgi:DNA polymerase III epsilon subunit-like protein